MLSYLNIQSVVLHKNAASLTPNSAPALAYAYSVAQARIRMWWVRDDTGVAQACGINSVLPGLVDGGWNEAERSADGRTTPRDARCCRYKPRHPRTYA